MDINYINNDYQFIYRVSALIFNEDKTKILLFKVDGRKFYMLPGGKVREKEESKDAIKREIEEELGYTNIEFNLLAISEELVEAKGYYNQQLNLIYKGILTETINNYQFKGKEGDWINFELVNIKDIDNYKVYPSNIIKVLENTDGIYHFIENQVNG